MASAADDVSSQSVMAANRSVLQFFDLGIRQGICLNIQIRPPAHVNKELFFQ
jgi:hypothetical protein